MVFERYVEKPAEGLDRLKEAVQKVRLVIRQVVPHELQDTMNRALDKANLALNTRKFDSDFFQSAMVEAEDDPETIVARFAVENLQHVTDNPTVVETLYNSFGGKYQFIGNRVWLEQQRIIEERHVNRQYGLRQ